eukprot:1185831-Rhodomonas_salina.1
MTALIPSEIWWQRVLFLLDTLPSPRASASCSASEASPHPVRRYASRDRSSRRRRGRPPHASAIVLGCTSTTTAV